MSSRILVCISFLVCRCAPPDQQRADTSATETTVPGLHACDLLTAEEVAGVAGPIGKATSDTSYGMDRCIWSDPDNPDLPKVQVAYHSTAPVPSAEELSRAESELGAQQLGDIGDAALFLAHGDLQVFSSGQKVQVTVMGSDLESLRALVAPALRRME